MMDTETIDQQLTIKDFRKEIKVCWPYVKITIRTVDFSNLARVHKKCLTVHGDRKGDLQHINALAEKAGILRDGNLRWFPTET